jgi:RNA polymerase primary sigma factor
VSQPETTPERRFLRAVFPKELPESTILVLFAPSANGSLTRLRQHINEALGTLSYRDRGILEMRYGLGDGHAYSLAEIGFVFRLTRERIRQIQGRAVRRLRSQADDLREFLLGLRS